MSFISPKTIVITAYPGKQSSISMPKADISVLDHVDPFDSSGPKKRRRLTHLTQDEKLLRRKLKNRVAAQTARDRKKALMTDLEEKVALLEEENKLLRRQNDTLRETSQNLVDENKALRTRLSVQSVPEAETESDASRSAEGTSPDSVSATGSVLHICGDTRHDNVINVFQRVSNLSCNSSSQTKTTTSSTQSPAQLSTSSTSKSRNSSSGVVGLSSAELESLNELIHIDHVYFKPQPSVQFKEEVVDTSEDIVLKVNNSEPVVTQFPQSELTAAPLRCKRDSRGNIISSKSPSMVVPDPSQCIANPASASLKFDSVDDDFVNSFSYPDIDSSLDLIQSLEFSSLLNGSGVTDSCTSSQIESLPSSLDISNNSDSNSHLPTKLTVSDISQSEMDSKKLFDEICDSYFSIKSSLSPDPGNFSDSGFGSDIGEAHSPQYSDGPLLDDYPWQDSFTDLFPDLQ